jgi:predicted ATP-grasp superfamily ATP-dependent carboligase
VILQARLGSDSHSLPLIVVVVAAQKGDLIAGYVAKAIETHRGASAVLKTMRNQFLEDFATDLVKFANISGFAEFDFLYDDRDNSFWMIDLNPRLIAMSCFTSKLVFEDAGTDVCSEYYLSVAGKPQGKRRFL